MDVSQVDLENIVEYLELLYAFEESESEAFRLVSDRLNELIEALISNGSE